MAFPVAAPASFPVELDNAVTFRGSPDPVGESYRPVFQAARLLQLVDETSAIKDIVAEDEGATVITYEIGANDQCLRDPVGI